MKRDYEIGLIINPDTAEEEAEKIKNSITEILTKGKGTIESVDDWGRKALAYPIEKHKEGVYVFIKTQAPGDVIATVERRLKLNEKVMRFIVIRLDDKLKKTNKLEKKWKRMEKFSKKSTVESGRERVSEQSTKSNSESKKAEVKDTKKSEQIERETKVTDEIKEEKKAEKAEEPKVKTETVKEEKEVEVLPKKETKTKKSTAKKDKKADEEVENAESK